MRTLNTFLRSYLSLQSLPSVAFTPSPNGKQPKVPGPSTITFFYFTWRRQPRPRYTGYSHGMLLSEDFPQPELRPTACGISLAFSEIHTDTVLLVAQTSSTSDFPATPKMKQHSQKPPTLKTYDLKTKKKHLFLILRCLKNIEQKKTSIAKKGSKKNLPCPLIRFLWKVNFWIMNQTEITPVDTTPNVCK